MASVKIGPSFFKKELREYSSWIWAYAREALQNCLDAPGSNAVDIAITQNSSDANDGVTVVFENNGKPMSEEILINKLLAIGESGKNFEGSVGGFGKAKVILYMAQERYTIRTGTFEVRGSGGEYELTRDLPYYDGTRSEVVISDTSVTQLTKEFTKFCLFAQWDGSITVNGEKHDCSLRKGSPRRELGFGQVYTNKSFTNRLIVRMNGIPMFWDFINLNRCVIVELNGSSLDVLTSNRDGLLMSYREELAEFIRELATDKRKALKRRSQIRYRHFSGAKYSYQGRPDFNARSIVGDVSQSIGSNSTSIPVIAISDTGNGVSNGGGMAEAAFTLDNTRIGVVQSTAGNTADDADDVPCDVVPRLASQIAEQFTIKNETELTIPNYYLPDSASFGTYARKLARIWGRLMLEMHRVFDHKDDFGIGFIFDDETTAEHEEGEFGRVYYISPAEIVTQASSNSKSFKKRFALTERNRLLAVAAHEFVHGLGYDSHDESYASKLTSVMAKVLDERKRFNWCFK